MSGDFRTRAVVVACCAAGLSVSYSAVFAVTFPIFMGPLTRDFGWSRGGLSMLLSVASMALTLATPFVGQLAQRVGSRAILLVFGVLFGAALASLAVIPANFGVFMAAMIFVGIAGAGTNTFVYVSVIPAWFSKRLGFALGMAMTGIGLGQAAFPIIAQALVETIGWRHAYLGLAGIATAVSTAAALILPTRPLMDRRDYPASGAEAGASRSEAMRDPRFWLLVYAFLAIALTSSACAIHAVPILIDMGLTPMQAAGFGAAGGLSVFIGRLGAGLLLDIVGPRVVGTAAFLCACLAPLLYMGMVPRDLMIVAPLFIGIAVGVEGDLMPYMVKSLFGLRDYPIIYSRIFASFCAGTVLGPVFLGVYYDLNAGYSGGLLAVSCLSLLATLAFLRACSARNNLT